MGVLRRTRTGGTGPARHLGARRGARPRCCRPAGAGARREGGALSENPRLGPARPDLAADLRYFPVGRYVLLYREIPGGVEIVRCVHGARDLPGLALPEE